MNTNCTWCQYLESLYSRDMKEELMRYIKMIPEEIRASDEVYEERLSQCNKCPDCQAGICRHCGCFVAARAAKAPLGCPKPGAAAW